MPASGFDIRMAAMPHVAIAQDGSCTRTSRKAFSVSACRNECSIATERWKLSCTPGLQEILEVDLAELVFGLGPALIGDAERQRDHQDGDGSVRFHRASCSRRFTAAAIFS